jgi:hypothetical protein
MGSIIKKIIEMKKLYILLFALIVLTDARGQSCFPEGITFMWQAQIDNFQTNNPNCTQIEGDVRIDGYNITNLNGLSVLTSIGGGLAIEGNPALTSLTGLNNLTSIGGLLEFWDNPALTSLTELSNLTSIDGELVIIENDALTSLTGLDNIDTGSIGDLEIYFNYMLSTCEVQSICDYLASPNAAIFIEDNAEDCNSREEVEAACGVFIEDLHLSSVFSIYPNPSSTQVTIEIKAIPTQSHLSIVNLSGQQLLKQEITEPTTTIDVYTLPSGVYMVKVVGEKGVQVEKFVKK